MAWNRPDKAFFAAGACHILGHLFTQLHRGHHFTLVHIKPHPSLHDRGDHMYAPDGTWAFDFNGWTLETELLKAHAAACTAKYPGWEYERVVVKEGLPLYAA